MLESEIASSDCEVGERRAKVAIFSLKFKRFCKMAIFSYKKRSLYHKILQSNWAQDENKMKCRYEGRSAIDFTISKLNNEVGVSVN